MTISNIVAGLCIAIWAICLTLSFLLPPSALNPSVTLVLMAATGGLVAITQREKVRR